MPKKAGGSPPPAFFFFSAFRRDFTVRLRRPLHYIGKADGRRAVTRYRDALKGLFSKAPLLDRLGQSDVVRRLLGLHQHQRGWVRKGFVLPLGLFVGLVVGSLWLFADREAHMAIERIGTELWGATVDVGSLDFSLTDGRLALTGLQLTDPSAPANNLIEIGVVGAAMSTGPS